MVAAASPISFASGSAGARTSESSELRGPQQVFGAVKSPEAGVETVFAAGSPQHAKLIGTIQPATTVALPPPSEKRPVDAAAAVARVIATRSQLPGLMESVRGALVYLDDSQIRERPGRRSSFFDASSGDGSKSTIIAHLPLLDKELRFDLPFSFVKNVAGEWHNDVHFIPTILGTNDDKALLTIPDSNMFVTAITNYPLAFFDESEVAPENRVIAPMRRRANEAIASFKRGDAYNFWPQLPGTTSDQPRVGPLNIPSKVVEALAKMYTSSWFAPVKKLLEKGRDAPPLEWPAALLDRTRNPFGLDSFFNVPNDADDTALALVTQKLAADLFDPQSEDPYLRDRENFRVDTDAMKLLSQFRDFETRTKDDERTPWRDTRGAPLTWLKSEDEPTFANPATGIIPTEVNNVDCVVVSNVLLAWLLNDRQDAPGVTEARQLLLEAVREKAWHRGHLYYPQQMMFPYTVSRAYRDGGDDSPEMREAMKLLLPTIIEEQAAFEAEHPGAVGAFPGGADKTTALSTALGVTCLLNIGREVAEELGIEQEYDACLENGVAHLLETRVHHAVENEETFNGGASSGCTWNGGLIGAASFEDIAYWRSEPYTVSMAMEALAKYAMAYDQSGDSLKSGARIEICDYDQFQLSVSR